MPVSEMVEVTWGSLLALFAASPSNHILNSVNHSEEESGSPVLGVLLVNQNPHLIPSLLHRVAAFSIPRRGIEPS